MDLFTVDTAGDADLLNANVADDETKYVTRGFTIENVDDTNQSDDGDEDEEEETHDYYGLPPPSVDVLEVLRNPTLGDKPLWPDETKKKTKKYDELRAFCKAMGWVNIDDVLPKKPTDDKKKKNRHNQWLEEDIVDCTDVHENLAKTDVKKEMTNCATTGIEKLRSIEMMSDRQAAKLRKTEREKTKGSNWFNMPATEITDELRQDMEIIQMRSVLNPTHFYKKNDLKTLPKYFQVGTVLPSPLDRYNDRGTRVNKKKSLVDELLEDAEFQQFNKRKYNEVMAEKSKTGFRKSYKKFKKSKTKS